MTKSLPNTLKKQISNNFIAIISLAIAISALAYNSWRNELSESNRNIRAAGFEIIKECAKLQYLIDRTTYLEAASDNSASNIDGWATVNLITSLSELMPKKVSGKAVLLYQVWEQNWEYLSDSNSNGRSEAANKEITKANNSLLFEVRMSLGDLH
jgi:hypothetical protein